MAGLGNDSSTRPVLAALASAIVPGAGQLIAGRRRRGVALLIVAAVVTAWGLWLTLFRPLTVATWGVQPTALRWLLVANGLALAFRVYAAADAYLVAGGAPHRGTMLGIGGVLALVTFVILAYPHAWAGHRFVAEYDLITTVFKPAPTTTTTTAPPPPTTVIAAPTPSGAPTVTVPDEPERPVLQPPASTTTTIPIRLWDGTERLNVLLLGGDGGPGRRGIRTDTIILASLDPKTGNAALFSVPRNMARVPLPESLGIWRCDCFPGIINALWKYGTDHPSSFPGTGPPGAEALKLAIGELTGLTIQHYALVNLEGFEDLIDAIGGVRITVTERVYEPNYGVSRSDEPEVIDILPGEYVMDGYTALAYARTRRGTSDYTRMGRQRCVLRALAQQADPLTVIRAFPDIANAIKNHVSTDIPLERLPDLIALLPVLDSDELISVRFVPPQYTGPRTEDGYNTPDLTAIRSVVDAVVTLPPEEVAEGLGLEDLQEECG